MKHPNSRGFAALALLSTCMASIDARAADGTIHFTGEIVAAPYEMRRAAAHAPTSTPTAPTAVRGIRGTGPVTEISFLRQHVDRPSGGVSVDALGALSLHTVFTDARGRSHVFDPAKTQAIGQDGGVLSIATQHKPPAGRAAAALVTVSYN